MMDSWLDKIKWDHAGLVPAIAQEKKTGEVLMMAWMNRKALLLTQAQRRAVYWSRSRQKLWFKGEVSGHCQLVRDIRLDCDADVVLLQVEQTGGVACHTGRQRCFFRILDNSQWLIDEEVIVDPDKIY